MGCYCFRGEDLPRLPDRNPAHDSSRVEAGSTNQSVAVARMHPSANQKEQVMSQPNRFLAANSKSGEALASHSLSPSEDRSEHLKHLSKNFESNTAALQVKLREVRTLLLGLEQSYLLGSERTGKLVKAEHRETGKSCWIQTCSLQAKLHHIELLRALDHPHILRVLEILKGLDNCYIVYEATTGATAEELIQRTGGVNERWTASMLRQVFAALAVCHSKGVVLQSLSPQHILFTEPPAEDCIFVKLLVPFEDEPRLPYQAPDTTTGPASDLYSCGIIITHLLLGELGLPSRASISSEFKYTYLKWSAVSLPVQSFVFSLISKNSRKRPILSECLQHPWICASQPRPELTPSVRKALRNLSQATPPSALKKALLRLTLNLVLSSEDLKEALEAFRELDTELKGSVSETQLRAPIFRLFPETQAQAALAAIASIAQDHQLTYSEFLLGAVCPTNHHFLRTFHILDREKDGTVTGKELREFLSAPLGNSFDLHHWRVLISAISHSTEGSFQYTDFLRYMRSP